MRMILLPAPVSFSCGCIVAFICEISEGFEESADELAISSFTPLGVSCL